MGRGGEFGGGEFGGGGGGGGGVGGARGGMSDGSGASSQVATGVGGGGNMATVLTIPASAPSHDGIIFAEAPDCPGLPVIYRTPEERLANPERLNLDRRSLGVCPILEGEHRLRLLNYQNNAISHISNLSNLPNLIFLDLHAPDAPPLEHARALAH